MLEGLLFVCEIGLSCDEEKCLMEGDSLKYIDLAQSPVQRLAACLTLVSDDRINAIYFWLAAMQDVPFPQRLTVLHDSSFDKDSGTWIDADRRVGGVVQWINVGKEIRSWRHM